MYNMAQNGKKQAAIEVIDVHKEFVMLQNKSTTLKQAVVNIVRKNHKAVYKVLDGITFDINKGDFFGIIGRNGSGKSTLLKLIAGVYEPTAGNIYVHGGLTPFIELGVGFNPELSGRDNVYLNGAMLGFTRKQMGAMYDDIVSFAEIEPFMDQKLKNYSSGMQVRLAFSIAIKAENDILMFDEVLAVGDANFQKKCIDQFIKLKSEGKTIVLVTHAMEMVKQFCNRVLLLNAGGVEFIGEPLAAIKRYNELNLISEKNDSIVR
jgi:ABC-2 type transport system ATP-binding protein